MTTPCSVLAPPKIDDLVSARFLATFNFRRASFLFIFSLTHGVRLSTDLLVLSVLSTLK